MLASVELSVPVNENTSPLLPGRCELTVTTPLPCGLPRPAVGSVAMMCPAPSTAPAVKTPVLEFTVPSELSSSENVKLGSRYGKPFDDASLAVKVAVPNMPTGCVAAVATVITGDGPPASPLGSV